MQRKIIREKNERQITAHYCVMYFLSHRVHCYRYRFTIFHIKEWFDDERCCRFEAHSREFYLPESDSRRQNSGECAHSGHLFLSISIWLVCVNYSIALGTLNISQIFQRVPCVSLLGVNIIQNLRLYIANVSYNCILLSCTNIIVNVIRGGTPRVLS